MIEIFFWLFVLMVVVSIRCSHENAIDKELKPKRDELRRRRAETRRLMGDAVQQIDVLGWPKKANPNSVARLKSKYGRYGTYMDTAEAKELVKKLEDAAKLADHTPHPPKHPQPTDHDD